MGDIAALLGRLQGVFGKTFLMAGVLPALVVILGLQSYRHGLAGVERLFVDFTTASQAAPETTPDKDEAGPPAAPADKPSAPLQAVGVVVFRIVLLLAAALLFFAVRHMILRAYQSLPLPGRLRQFLIDRQDARRRRIKHREKHLSLTYTAVRWPLDRCPVPRFRVAGYEQEPDDRVLKISRTGWEALQDAADRRGEVRVVRRREYELVRAALVAHYSYASAAKTAHPDITQWNTLLTDDTPAGQRRKAAYDVCVARASRLWIQAASTQKNYPSPDYVMPTMLGTRLAALDEYAQARYGIDTTTLWLRLWGLLSKDEKAEVADAQTSVQCLLNIATALLATAAWILAEDLWRAWPQIRGGQAHFSPRVALFVVVPLVLSCACYRSAVFATIAFSERVTRCLDLYWLRFLATVGYKLPQNATAQVALDTLRGIGAFYLAADARGIAARTVACVPAEKGDKSEGEGSGDTAGVGTDGFVD